jgi:ubiquinone biosynthesis protein UbiJ
VTTLERSLEPDAEQVEAQYARTLLELAGRYVSQTLGLSEQVETLQSITANLLFENAALRWQVDRLSARLDALERKTGGR